MSRRAVRAVLIVILAAIIYFVAATYFVGYSFGGAPGLQALQDTFGPLGGTLVWAHLVHAIGLVIAATPAALLLSSALRPRAVRCSLVAGCIAAITVLVPTLISTKIRAQLEPSDLIQMSIDSFKAVLILVLLTWLLTKLPSNHALERPATDPVGGTAGAPEIIAPAAPGRAVPRPAQRGR